MVKMPQTRMLITLLATVRLTSSSLMDVLPEFCMMLRSLMSLNIDFAK